MWLDEIRSASDADLLRMYRLSVFRNKNGRRDTRLKRIRAEMVRRTRKMLRRS